MRELPGPQQSDQWIKNRVGRITASRMDAVMHVLSRKSKNGSAGEPGGKYVAYRRELVAERILGRAADHFVTRYMEEGSEREAEACSMYELATRQMVVPVGFVLHPVFDWAGASPDGLLPDRTLQLKSPKPETLLEWLETNEIPDEYAYQVQWEMRCCDREVCDFYGWYPGMPHFFKTVERNKALLDEMEERAQTLHLEVESFLARIGQPPTVFDCSMPAPEPDYDPDKSFAENCSFIDGEMVP